MIFLTTENILLIGSILIFSAILITTAGQRFGVPALLLFLVVGMVFGSDGLGLQFNNYRQAQFIGVVALSVILFTGGMETRFVDIKPVLAQGVILATLGVFLTTLFCGFFIFSLTNVLHISAPLSLVMCLLMAAVMSSTDSASVFNILKNCRMRLKYNVRPMLELESGSNDPMAYVITIVLIEAVQMISTPEAGVTTYWPMVFNAVKTFVLQLLIGAAAGIGLGFGGAWLLKKIRLDNTPLYAIMLLTSAFFTMSVAELLYGNGYLAVYISGLIIGNSVIQNKDRPMNNRREITSFLDGMTWLMQISMFLILGLLVNPHEMVGVAPLALLTGLFMIFVARPVSVFLCLLPCPEISTEGMGSEEMEALGLKDDKSKKCVKIPAKAKTFVSWVGLKGAAPIIFATYPVVENIEGADLIFNSVFFITMLSLIIQGMSVPKMARTMKLNMAEAEASFQGLEIPEEAGRLVECTLSENDLAGGNTLKEVTLPSGARVVMIQRGSKLIVPDGSVPLQADDRLLMIFGDPAGTSEQGPSA